MPDRDATLIVENHVVIVLCYQCHALVVTACVARPLYLVALVYHNHFPCVLK